MKEIQLIILFIFICIFRVSGQPLLFKGERVDTLRISAGHAGDWSGIWDEYVIILSKKGHYTLDVYRRFRYSRIANTDSFESSSRVLKKQKKIKRELLSDLLFQLNSRYIEPNFKNLGITQKQFLKLTDKKEVNRIIQENKEGHNFNYQISNEQQELIYNGCQNIENFDSFLKTKYDTSPRQYEYVRVTIGYSDNFTVTITTEKLKYKYRAMYPNIYRQPWRDITFGSGSKPIINFGINTALLNLLPRKFSRLSTIKFQVLTDEFIKSYLEENIKLFLFENGITK